MWIVACSVFGCTPVSSLSGSIRPPGEAGGADGAVEQAREDLACRKGADKGLITAVKIEAVDWPDTSLGCPQPDMVYAQVITPGFRIVLSCADRTYVYHSDRGNRVVYCEDTHA